jgi:hypothetical protein
MKPVGIDEMSVPKLNLAPIQSVPEFLVDRLFAPNDRNMGSISGRIQPNLVLLHGLGTVVLDDPNIGFCNQPPRIGVRFAL